MTNIEKYPNLAMVVRELMKLNNPLAAAEMLFKHVEENDLLTKEELNRDEHREVSTLDAHS